MTLAGTDVGRYAGFRRPVGSATGRQSLLLKATAPRGYPGQSLPPNPEYRCR
jgi:hypothetical protein